MRLATTFAIALMFASPAVAEPPQGDTDSAAGYYADDGQRIEFTHATALAIDNAEGLEDGPMVRVFLSDRTVPIEAIAGVVGLGVERMAAAGGLTGLIVEFATDERDAASLRPLFGDGQPLPTVSLSNSEGMWDALSISGGRVAGTLKPGSYSDYAITFDAPLQSDPVVETLTGKAARESEFAKIALARIDAVAAGDFDRATALSTKAAGEEFSRIPPEARKQLRSFVVEMRKNVGAFEKVVVRANSATAIGSDGFFVRFSREDGEWRIE